MRLKKLKTSEKRRMIKKPSDAHDLQLLLLYPADHRPAQFETSFPAKLQPAVSLGHGHPSASWQQRAAEDTSKPAPLPCPPALSLLLLGCATEHPMFNNALENKKKLSK